MNKQLKGGLVAGILMAGLAGSGFSAIIDFTGGIAHLSNGSTVVTDNVTTYWNVDYYEEDGFKIDFVGDGGIIGNYEGDNNSVIHVHWAPTYGTTSAVIFTKLDGSTMDLNYIDESTNTIVGGGTATGNERSYLTASNGTQILLPVSDWGLSHLSGGAPGDGAEHLLFDSRFDAITSFTITSENAYCFGMDNFYIDEAAPPSVPEPATFSMMLIGLFGLAGTRLIKKRKA